MQAVADPRECPPEDTRLSAGYVYHDCKVTHTYPPPSVTYNSSGIARPVLLAIFRAPARTPYGGSAMMASKSSPEQ